MQSRKWSLIEAVTNVAVGFLIGLFSQVVIFRLFGMQVSFSQNLVMAYWFTAISVVRSYALRRVFNRIKR